MYQIKRTKLFEKSYKKIKNSGILKPQIIKTLENVIDSLKNSQKLDKKFKDHQLIGELKEFRECHIKDDLLLVYKIEDSELILILVDIGSHTSVFS